METTLSPKSIAYGLALCFVIFTPLKVWADEPRVTKAQVYLDQAVLLIPMTGGESSVMDLPGTIDLNSISLELSGKRVLNSTSIEELPRSLWIPPALASLAASRDQTQRAFLEKQGIVNTMEQTLKNLDETKPEVSPHEIGAYVTNFMEARGGIAKRLVTEKESMRKLGMELDDLEKTLLARVPETDQSMIRVTARSSGEGDLFLRSRTYDAGWKPSYRMNMDLEKGTLTAQLNGTLWQKTGLTFSGEISLHMGRPSTFSDPVKLSPLTVRLVNPSDVQPSYKSESRMMAPAMMAESMLDSAMDVAVEESIMDRSFSFTGEIRGDGVPSTISLESWSTDVKAVMVAVPSLSPTLWLLAEGKMPDGRTIPSEGEMYVDGRFSGKWYVPSLVRGQSFSMPFGEIPGVKVEREDKIPQSGSTWIGKGTLRRGYVISLTNGLQKAISVTVKDRVPVTTNDRISISLSEVVPSASEIDQERGILSWGLDIAPGEKKEIHVIYDVRYPSDRELLFSR